MFVPRSLFAVKLNGHKITPYSLPTNIAVPLEHKTSEILLNRGRGGNFNRHTLHKVFLKVL